MEKYLPILRNSPFFKGLTDNEILSILHCVNATVILKKRDSYIFRAGDSTEVMGLVVSGCVLVMQEDLWGHRNILAKCHAGDFFGEPYAAEAGGADALSLINTLTGMKIDINRRTFAVANKTGGVSGPVVHPIAVRMVYQTAQAVNIPIIGMGGIATPEDAIEMILAGASAVSVGTANFYNPNATIEIIDGIEAYMKKNGFESVKDMVGIVK